MKLHRKVDLAVRRWLKRSGVGRKIRQKMLRLSRAAEREVKP